MYTYIHYKNQSCTMMYTYIHYKKSVLIHIPLHSTYLFLLVSVQNVPVFKVSKICRALSDWPVNLFSSHRAFSLSVSPFTYLPKYKGYAIEKLEQ